MSNRSSFMCGSCGGETKVVDTRMNWTFPQFKRRTRQCTKCKAREMTKEIAMPSRNEEIDYAFYKLQKTIEKVTTNE